MPIKEIMTYATILMSGWFLTGGREGMLRNIRKTQVAILREVTRTDNWGNPSIFQHTLKGVKSRSRTFQAK